MRTKYSKPISRPPFIIGYIGFIPLTQGMVAIIDAEDMHIVEDFNWTLHPPSKGNTFYAIRRELGKCILMHRAIMDATGRVEVDHRSNNGLDNRKTNLRLATHSQNLTNQVMRPDNKTGRRGVCMKNGRFYAQIQVDRVKIYLGYYATLEEAAIVYEEAAKRYLGEFARTL